MSQKGNVITYHNQSTPDAPDSLKVITFSRFDLLNGVLRSLCSVYDEDAHQKDNEKDNIKVLSCGGSVHRVMKQPCVSA